MAWQQLVGPLAHGVSRFRRGGDADAQLLLHHARAGALAALVADLAGADLWLQIVVLCIVSLLMIAFVRPIALKHLHKGPAEQRTNVDRLIGQSALVMEPVSATAGLVKIGGDVWSARSAAEIIDAGQTVQVTRIDGATAVVAPTAENSPH